MCQTGQFRLKKWKYIRNYFQGRERAWDENVFIILNLNVTALDFSSQFTRGEAIPWSSQW